MDRRQQDTLAQSNWVSPPISKPRGRSRHRAKRARAERDNERRVDQGEFPVQPPTAVIDPRALGVLWMRRFPRGTNLKCLTAFVR
jgi:hypothetical protein